MKQQAEAIAKALCRLEALADALAYLGDSEQERALTEGKYYAKGVSNCAYTAASNIREILKGNVPPMLQPGHYVQNKLDEDN